MVTPHVDEALRKSIRLRSQVAGLDPCPPERPGLGSRVWKGIKRLVVCAVVVFLGAAGLFTYHEVKEAKQSSRHSATAGGPAYSDLRIFEELGTFAGQVAVTNPFDHDIWVNVTVNLYDGDQAVGEISGHVTLKPVATSRIDLSGLDRFTDYTETRVHLSGFADPAS